MLVDTAMLVTIVALALYADRFWPLWLAAFQVIQVVAHVPELLIPQLLPTAYGLIISVWAYPMLVILAIGTWRHRQRIKLFGKDASWSSFSPQQTSKMAQM
jgi:hypothetical protein